MSNALYKIAAHQAAQMTRSYMKWGPVARHITLDRSGAARRLLKMYRAFLRDALAEMQA